MRHIISPYLDYSLDKSEVVRVYVGSLEAADSDYHKVLLTRQTAEILALFAEPVPMRHAREVMRDQGLPEECAEALVDAAVVIKEDDANDQWRARRVFENLERRLRSQLEDAAGRATALISHVETTNRCNMHCLTCPRGNDTYSTPVSDMEGCLFATIVEQLADRQRGSLLRLWLFGDPLLDPLLHDRASTLTARGIPFALSVNPGNLAIGRMRSVLEQGVAVIVISLDADRAETYRQRRGGDFEKALRRTHELIELVEEQDYPTKLIVQYVASDGIDKEAESFIDRWEQVPRVEWLVRVLQDLPDMQHTHPRHIINRAICTEAWALPFTISSSGQMLPCPVDHTRASAIADLHESTIWSAITSPCFARRRESHFENLLSKRAEPCARCGQRNMLNQLIDRYVTSSHPLYERFGRRLASRGAMVL